MLRNYLKIAWRNLLKMKSYSLVNLLGLTVGTLSCLAIMLYVQSQFGYEKDFKNANLIYGVTTEIKSNGEGLDFNSMTASPNIGPALQQAFEEIESQTRVINFAGNNEFLLEPDHSDLAFFESDGYLVDSSFLDFFDFNLLEGNPATALNSPDKIVLSSSLAKKLFGVKTSALGKSINLSGNGEKLTAQVTGVFDEKIKSHLKPNYLLNIRSTGLGQYVFNSDELVVNNFVNTYIKVNSHTSSDILASKLPSFLEVNAAERLKEFNMEKALGLVPIAEIHLKTADKDNHVAPVSDMNYIYLLLAIAFFIQLMACVNYINLTTAQAEKRAKEIGVRKVNGAASGSLTTQFMIESVLYSFLAVILTIPLLILFLPFINTLLDSQLQNVDVLTLKMSGIMLSLWLVTGFLSGAYPALYLSLMNPLKILKKGFKSTKGALWMRNGLVVFQFVMVFTLIYCVSVVSRQISHLNNSDLGFSKEQKLIIPLKTDEAMNSYEVLSNRLKALSHVKDVSGSTHYPSQNILQDRKMYKRGESVEQGILSRYNETRENFFDVMDIEILAGRRPSVTDSMQMLVNESFLRAFNISLNDAVGQYIIFSGEESSGSREIVGVFSDYNFSSLRDEVVPVVSVYYENVSNLILSYQSDDPKETLSQIRSVWEETNANVPFEYRFLDEELGRLYEAEVRLNKVSGTFATLAILLSLLGTWGLVSFKTQQRFKEIGVRKVLGASVGEITRLLSKEFFILVGLSILVGIPVGVYSMNSWLDNYTYRIDNTTGLIAFSALLTLLVCLLSVIYKTILAARANPINSIKAE